MRRSNSQVDLTKGSTFRNMVIFSLPIMLQGSFQILYNLVDRYWVGQLGKEAFAAVTVGFPIMFFIISLLIGIASGAGIMIAQYRGAQDRGMVNLTSRNFIVFGSLAVLVVSLVMLLNVGGILNLLNTPKEIHDQAAEYLRWIFAGLIFFFGYNSATGIFRGLGDSATPTKVAAFTTVLNIILDPILIFGLGPVPRLEVTGAAIATVLANAVGVVIIFVLLAREKEWVDLALKGFRFDWKNIREILRLGLPTTGTMMMVSMSIMVIMWFVNDLGTVAVAAYGVGIALDQLIMMPSMSFGLAMTTAAGQNIGAGKMDRVGKYLTNAITISLSIAIVVGIIIVVTIPWVAGWFIPDEADYAEVYPLVHTYVMIMTVRYVMMSMFFPINGAIRGAGDTMASMVLSFFNQLLFRIPIAIYLASHYGFTGIAIALAASPVMGFILVTIYYRLGWWKSRALVSNDRLGLRSSPDDES